MQHGVAGAIYYHAEVASTHFIQHGVAGVIYSVTPTPNNQGIRTL